MQPEQRAGGEREHPLDRHLTGTDLGAQADVGGGEPAAHGVGLAGVDVLQPRPGAEDLLRDGPDRRPRDQQRHAGGKVVDPALERDREGGFSDRGEHAGVALEIDLAETQLQSAEIAPRGAELGDHRLQQALRERPVDFAEAPLGGGLGGVAAEQALERLQYQRRLDAEQHLRVDRLHSQRHGDRVRRQWRLGGRPGELAGVRHGELHRSAQLGGEPHREGFAEGAQRTQDPAAQLGGELGGLGEVHRADHVTPCRAHSPDLARVVDGGRSVALWPVSSAVALWPVSLASSSVALWPVSLVSSAWGGLWCCRLLARRQPEGTSAASKPTSLRAGSRASPGGVSSS